MIFLTNSAHAFEKHYFCDSEPDNATYAFRKLGERHFLPGSFFVWPVSQDSLLQVGSANTEALPSPIDYKEIALKNDRWFGHDKLLHFSYSFVFTVGLKTLGDNLLGFDQSAATISGAGLTFFLGFGKEVNDNRNPRNIFSVKDLVADVLGIAAGILFLQLF
ncbi:DUF2279 domain-containing protein [Chloroherpeton thalassium]|nr:DUF2279 domain-containing protein [Chloroherpeton thalassium]